MLIGGNTGTQTAKKMRETLECFLKKGMDGGGGGLGRADYVYIF